MNLKKYSILLYNKHKDGEKQMKFGELLTEGNATDKQLDFIRSLCKELGYEPDEDNLFIMTKKEASDTIKDLLEELGR